MFLSELMIALLVGILVVVATGALFGRGGPWTGTGPMGGYLWFFLVVFLGAWAIGTWTTPVGPMFWGVSWVPFLFGAVAIALLLGALSAPRSPATPPEVVAGAEAEATLGAFFWAFLLVLAVAIVVGSI